MKGKNNMESLERRIIDFLDKEGSIDDDEVVRGNYPFTSEEFRQFIDKIWKDAGAWDSSYKYQVKGAYFETYYVPFEYDGKKYILNIMCGQGYAWTVRTEASHKQRIAELDQEI
jgi:hypothetical protein